MLKKKFFLYLFVGFIGYIFSTVFSLLYYHGVTDKILYLNHFTRNNNHTIVFEIEEVSALKETGIEYKGFLLSVNGDKVPQPLKGLFIFPSNMALQKYTVLQANTKIYDFENTPSFSYKDYMLSQGMFFKSYINNSTILSLGKIHPLEQAILSLRKNFLHVINTLYPHEEAIFLGGILIGAKENIPLALKTDFNNSGLAHLIAVSGFNITIVILFITKIFQSFPNTLKIILVTLAIGFFVILVGETAPVMRASISGLLGYYILVSGRQQEILSVIFGTLGIMTLINPLSINYDISLQLSFLALLGIIYTQKFFSKIFYFIPNILEIRTSFVLTLGALCFTLPLIICNFGQLSIIAPLANIAITWTMGLSMLLGFMSIIVYFVAPILGFFIGYITWVFLKWDIMMVHFFGNLHWAILKFDIGIYKTNFMILYFSCVIFSMLWLYEKNKA